MSDAKTRLLFKFRSGTHGENEELGRHRGREGMRVYVCCADMNVRALVCGNVQLIVVLELTLCCKPWRFMLWFLRKPCSS